MSSAIKMYGTGIERRYGAIEGQSRFQVKKMRISRRLMLATKERRIWSREMSGARSRSLAKTAGQAPRVRYQSLHQAECASVALVHSGPLECRTPVFETLRTPMGDYLHTDAGYGA